MRILLKVNEADGGVLRPFRRTRAEDVCDCEIQGAGAENQGEQNQEGKEVGQSSFFIDSLFERTALPLAIPIAHLFPCFPVESNAGIRYGCEDF